MVTAAFVMTTLQMVAALIINIALNNNILICKRAAVFHDFPAHEHPPRLPGKEVSGVRVTFPPTKGQSKTPFVNGVGGPWAA